MQGTVIYAPSSFEERGVAVSFTTPLLSQTRVRRDARNRLEILIPSFSEGKGIYVVPWKAVPEMVSMTVHDRYLHEQIVKTAACSPVEIRTATLKAARNGLAGPDAARKARLALAEDEEHRTVTNFLLIVEVLRVAGMESLNELRNAVGSREGEAMARRHIERAAQALKLDANELYHRVAEIAGVMTPIGLVQAPSPGRLRRRLRELAEFRDAVQGWAKEDGSETAPVASFCAEIATHTLAIGEKTLMDFDARARAIGPAIRDWNDSMAAIRDVADRLTWLVDGWDFVAAAWADAMERDVLNQRMTINEIFRVLPLVPTREGPHRHADRARDVMQTQRRSVKAYEDWRSGSRDLELIHRIECVKTRAA